MVSQGITNLLEINPVYSTVMYSGHDVIAYLIFRATEAEVTILIKHVSSQEVGNDSLRNGTRGNWEYYQSIT